tara:strand:- start:14092 stop:14703 length:612 start_codon:yes stop_codon:yes gene_type:complete
MGLMDVLKQFNEIKRLGKEKRLAADGWDKRWKTLVATLLSARTTDKKTIPVATALFEKFDSIEKLSKAKESEIAESIREVNFYKTKARNVKALAEKVVREYEGVVPQDFDSLVELPGVGRKTANVFLAEQGEGTIGVDTHVSWISKQMGWTEHEKQEKVEEDLKKLFPEEKWGEINWVLVRFGQTYTSRKEKEEILERIKKGK